MKIYNGNHPLRNSGYIGVTAPIGTAPSNLGSNIPLVEGVQDINDISILRPAGQWPTNEVSLNSGLTFLLDAGRGSVVSNQWLDTSGNNYHATLYNSPVFNSDYGGSVIFNGVNQYGNQPYVNLQSLGTYWTFICFYRTLTFSGYQTIWSNATQWDPQGRGNPKLHGVAYVTGEAWTSRYTQDSYGSKVLWGTGSQASPTHFLVGNGQYDNVDNGWRSVCILGYTFGGENQNGATEHYWYVNNVYRGAYVTSGFRNGIDWIGNRANFSGDIWIGGINAQRRSDGGFFLTQYSNIEIAVIMLYNRQLNETERTSIWNSYRWRYGI